MHRLWSQYCKGMSLCLFAALSMSAEDLTQLRDWTSRDGRTVHARLIESNPDARTAKLKRADGYVFSLQWEQLSLADQESLSASSMNEQKAAAEAAELPAAPVELPDKYELKGVPMVVQKENYCVPASATMIARFHEVDTDQDQVAKLSSEGSETNQGTYPSDMLRAMNKLGFSGEPLHWQDNQTFFDQALPAIRQALVNIGPIYISFKAGAFGTMGHGCVIVGYNDRKEELLFYNPWGSEFERSYIEVARLGNGVVLIHPPGEAPVAGKALLDSIQNALKEPYRDFFQCVSALDQSPIEYELIWCNRHDERDDRKFADKTARRDGRQILELAFERNPAVIIPYSPEGSIDQYFLITRPSGGGARFEVCILSALGWSEPELYTIGSLTREWPTLLKLPQTQQAIWELPLIELRGIKTKR